MEVKDTFIIKHKDGSEEKCTIIEKGTTTNEGKKGYLAISANKELKYYTFPQFHMLKSQGVIICSTHS
jgi:hypothetical protein